MTQHRVVIDTDPGVDDAVAILMALASPELEVLGIAVVAGNVPVEAATRNACKLVALSGRSDAPVHSGAPGPLVRDQVYGKYAAIGAFDDRMVKATDVTPARDHAVPFLVRTARQAAAQGRPITVCAIGPLTNIALALIQHPDVAIGIGRIVAMGGAFAAMGNRAPWAEFNIYADPHAAGVVLRSGVPVVLMPLDVTFKALFTADHIARFRRGGETGAALSRLFSAFDRSDVARLGRPGAPIHDAMTVAWLVRPELFAGREVFVGVEQTGETMGHVYADFHGKLDRPPNALVVTDVDEPGFIDFVIERIARYGDTSSFRAATGGARP